MPDVRKRTLVVSPWSPEAGFSLVELLVILILATVISLIGYPALLHMIYRARHEGIARQTAVLIRQARLEAVKRQAPAGVAADLANERVVAFRDLNDNGAFDLGVDEQLSSAPLPRHTDFAGPAADPAPVDGFPNNAVIFDPTGTANSDGAFRLADRRENFLEVRVSPRATGRVVLRKYDGGWKEQGEGGQSWRWE